MNKQLLGTAILLFCHALIFSQNLTKKTDHRLGEILIQTKDAPSVYKVLNSFSGDNFAQSTDFRLETVSSNLNIYHLFFDPNLIDENELIKNLRFNNDVKAVQFNHIAELRSVPNDSLFSQQWNMKKINAPSVWDATTGGLTACGDTIVVAVLDVGFDISHPDLRANIWRNRAEIPNNGIDDDKNGYVDDFSGLNVSRSNDKHDVQAHGTNCLGVIGASGNNTIGISGVNWNVKMLVLSGVTDDAKIIEAYTYAQNLRKKYNQTNGKEGAFVAVTSMSLGYANKRPEDFPLVCAIYNSLGEQGILNVVSADNVDNDINVSGDIPGLCPSDYLVVVTRTDEKDLRPRTAGYSKDFVDLAAPGENVTSTTLYNNYDIIGGNSFAAPLVAGAAALLWSAPYDSLCKMSKKTPTAALNIVKDAILRGVDPVLSMKDKTVTGGRLNVAKSLDILRSVYGMPVGTYDILKMPSILGVNPTIGSKTINVTLRLPANANVSLIISNTIGQIVFQKKINEKDLLSNFIALDTEILASGIYYLSLLAEDFEVTKKFVILNQ